MSEIKPFYGIHFDSKNISKLICPPYDVISREQKSKLKKNSKNNMVYLELPDPVGSTNKYQQAGVLFKKWLNSGELQQDCEPSYYIYEQKFKAKDKVIIRRGFFAALKLEQPGKGNVKPHEKTLSKPKEDRLKLMRAVKANLSPIFGLYNDDSLKTVKSIKNICSKKPLVTAKDVDKVEHKLWKTSGGNETKVFTDVIKKRQIFIADGHHRYETAWNFSQEMKRKGIKGNEYNYIMIFLCPIEDPGLVVWPTHRVVEPPKDIEEKIQKYFNVLPQSEFNRNINKLPQPLLVYKKGQYRTLILKDKATLAKAMKDKCEEYRNLGVSMLHSILLDGIAPDKIKYVKKDYEAIKAASKNGYMAIMVPSTPVDAVKSIALNGQTMPQKSTYFYPKVATGMVIHSLTD